MRADPCPWCGRRARLDVGGVLPRHKRIVGPRTARGHVLREWCEGGGQLPFFLSVTQRRALASQWRDEDGDLLPASENPWT